MAEQVKVGLLDTASEILDLVRKKQQLQLLVPYNDKVDATEEKELTTDEYLYDLKLRKYLRDIQNVNRRIKKRNKLLEVDSGENADSVSVGAISLAERIREGKYGSALSVSVPDSSRNVSRNSNLKIVYDSYITPERKKKSVASQTKLSCLVSEFDPLVEGTLLDQLRHNIRHEDVLGDTFLAEIRDVRKFLRRDLEEHEKRLDNPEIYKEEEDSFIKDRSVNTECDPLFLPLCRIDVYSTKDKMPTFKHNTQCSHGSPQCEVCIKYFDDLFRKYKLAPPRIDSRWPKGHKYYTKATTYDNESPQIIQNNELTETSHYEETLKQVADVKNKSHASKIKNKPVQRNTSNVLAKGLKQKHSNSVRGPIWRF